MRSFTRLSAALLIATIAAPVPAQAGWSIRHANREYQTARDHFAVTPLADWNKWSERSNRYQEVWSKDGLGLNELSFIGGVKDGKTIFKQPDKKYDPLPKFRANMLLSDLPELFETSARIILKSSAFETTQIAPTKLGGHDAVRFGYRYTVQDEEVVRDGEAYAAIVDRKLYMVTFEAPKIYYFERDIERFRAMVGTIRILK